MNSIMEISDLLEMYKNKQLGRALLLKQLEKISKKTDGQKDAYSVFVRTLIMNIEEIISAPSGKDIDYFINTLKGAEGYKLSYSSLIPLSIYSLNETERKTLKIAESYGRKRECVTQDMEYIIRKQKDGGICNTFIRDIVEIMRVLYSPNRLRRYENLYPDYFVKVSLEEKLEHIVTMFENNRLVYCVMTFEKGFLRVKYIV